MAAFRELYVLHPTEDGLRMQVVFACLFYSVVIDAVYDGFDFEDK